MLLTKTQSKQTKLPYTFLYRTNYLYAVLLLKLLDRSSQSVQVNNIEVLYLN